MTATLIDPSAYPLSAPLAVVCACLLVLSACQKAPATGTPAAASKALGAATNGRSEETAQPTEAPHKETAGPGVTLSADQVHKLGIVVTAAPSANYTPEATGYAVVMAHEPLAQALAELITAESVDRQSSATLARVERLEGTAGALSADARESAARQAAVDQAALALAHQRLSTVIGQHPPWREGDTAVLTALAQGKIKLVRVTFPLGQIEEATPTSLRLAPLNAAHGGKRRWKSDGVWDAPADASVPGRSFFALLKGNDAGEGERLLAWAPIGVPASGVLVPESAIVISEDKYWCYLERKVGVFVRVEIDPHRPLPDGYFMSERISAGDPIVTQAAGLLLARETNSGAAAD